MVTDQNLKTGGEKSDYSLRTTGSMEQTIGSQ